MRALNRSLLTLGLLGTLGAAAVAAPKKDAASQPTGASAPAGTPKPPKIEFKPYTIADGQQGGMPVAAITVPKGWRTQSQVRWDLTSGNNPARLHFRSEAPDGSAWIESFPMEVFFWLPVPDRTKRVGSVAFGMVYAPGVGILDAMKYFVLQRYRGRAQNVRLIGARPIGNLAALLHKPAQPGESIAARIQYTLAGHTVDEEFFCMLSPDTPVSGEHHRSMTFVHSMGAVDGKLKSMEPVLSYVASSFRVNPAWVERRNQVAAQIMQRFNQGLAAHAADRAAAAAMSQQTMARSDAFLKSVDAKQRESDAFLKSVDSQSARPDSSDGFDQYIRGTEVVKDPYWGTSEQPYQQKYHWTDGYGNYQNSDDVSFNPNDSSNVQWQQMETVAPSE